jgi:hypothetical protein
MVESREPRAMCRSALIAARVGSGPVRLLAMDIKRSGIV